MEHSPRLENQMTATPQVEPMLPAAMLARQLGLSPQTIRNWIHSGELEAVNVARRGASRPRYVVSQENINAFLASRRIAG